MSPSHIRRSVQALFLTALVAGLAITAGAAQQVATPTAPPLGADAATRILADAHKAMGGDARQSAVSTLVATGSSRRVAGENLVPIEFEIDIELPNKYVRKDEIPPQETTPSSTGFNGADLIQFPAPSQPLQDAQRKTRITSVKQDFARLMLGMFARSFASYPISFNYVGSAEAPEGKADVLDGTGPDNFAVRLLIDSTTHLPIMVSWTAATPAGRGSAPVAAPVETRLYFFDYRDTNGLIFPFKIRRAVGPNTVEETTVDRFKVNVKIDPKKFDVVK